MSASIDPKLDTTPSTTGGSVIEDYANAPVPHSLTVNGWRVAMIVTGFNIALPGFLNGAQAQEESVARSSCTGISTA